MTIPAGISKMSALQTTWRISPSHLVRPLGKTFERPFAVPLNTRVRRVSQRTQLRYNSNYLTRDKGASGDCPSFAFAFDIDGVLLRESKPIPGAKKALRGLQERRIPFILLTNGGGKHERERVEDLSQKLEIDLSVTNFIQSHTPFRELVNGPDGLGDKTVLVTGSNAAKCREIAYDYGFKNVLTPADILNAYPTFWPFDPLLDTVYNTTAKPLTEMPPKIDGIFVYNDPRDWALDVQIIIDLLLSDQGVLGTYSPRNGDKSLPNDGWQSGKQPQLFFSNPDLFWSTAYHQPRFGQGAFQAALVGIWKEVTGGKELKRRTMGKPFRQTYEYAEHVLNGHRESMLGIDNGRKTAPLRRVYMVGDNPESDIKGANDFKSPTGTAWTSILVRTGVWSEERGSPIYSPKAVADDVGSAVEWALRQEGCR